MIADVCKCVFKYSRLYLNGSVPRKEVLFICTLIRHLTPHTRLPPPAESHLIKLENTCDSNKKHTLFVWWLRWSD